MGSYIDFYSSVGIEIKNPKQKGLSSVKCPFHDDNNSSAGIDINNGVFTCRGCNLDLSVLGFAQKYLGKTKEEARKEIEKYVTTKESSKKHEVPSESSQWGKLLKLGSDDYSNTFIINFSAERGFNLDVLKEEEVLFLSQKTIEENIENFPFAEDCLIIPNYYGDNICSIHIRSKHGEKRFATNSVQIPWGINKLTPEDKIIVVCEGESDRLKLLSEFKERELLIKVISCPGTGSYKEEWGRDFTNVTKIILIPDSDNAGKALVKSFKEYQKDKVFVIDLPWKPKQFGKDICSWANQNDFEELIALIVTEVIYTQKNTSEILNTEDFYNSLSNEESIPFIDNFFYRGQIGILGGQMKSRKTWILLNFVKCLLNPGEEFLGLPELVSNGEIPVILFIQMEGSKKKFLDRIKKVIGDNPYANNVHWWFKPALQLDNIEDVQKLANKINSIKANILILDPFQNLHSRDEDSSTDTSIIWSNLFTKLVHRFSDLGIIIAHHFGKDKTIKDKWSALRGSSRMGGAVDFGMFIEYTSDTQAKIAFDFRDEEPYLSPDGKAEILLNFQEDDGSFSLNSNSVVIDKSDLLVDKIVEAGGEMAVLDILKLFTISNYVLKKWVTRLNDRLEYIRSAPGRPAIVRARATGKKD